MAVCAPFSRETPFCTARCQDKYARACFLFSWPVISLFLFFSFLFSKTAKNTHTQFLQSRVRAEHRKHLKAAGGAAKRVRSERQTPPTHTWGQHRFLAMKNSVSAKIKIDLCTNWWPNTHTHTRGPVMENESMLKADFSHPLNGIVLHEPFFVYRFALTFY